MTAKAAFNAEEWSVVVGAPLLAAMLVVAADKGGTLRESVAVSRFYTETAQQEHGEFMSALLSSPPALDRSKAPRTRDDLRTVAPAQLREAVGILERVATEDEVIEFKRFVHALAESVARAHKEGGFLGIGGTEISEHERAVLDEIEAIFDELPPSDEPPPSDEAPPPDA
jgi:hypothetical protein